MLCVHIVYTLRDAHMMKWLLGCILGEVGVCGKVCLFSEICVHGEACLLCSG